MGTAWADSSHWSLLVPISQMVSADMLRVGRDAAMIRGESNRSTLSANDMT